MAMLDFAPALIRSLTLAGIIVLALPFDACLAGQQKIEVEKSQTGDTRQYLVKHLGCRLTVSISPIPNTASRLLDMDTATSCDEPTSVQLEVFRRMLRIAADDRSDFSGFRGVGLPKIDFSKDFLARIARSAYASAQWKKDIKNRKAGAGVNEATLNLLKDTNAYAEFITLLQEFGLKVELVSVEKAFLTTVLDLASRKARISDLSELPRGFLVPATANPRFKIVPD